MVGVVGLSVGDVDGAFCFGTGVADGSDGMGSNRRLLVFLADVVDGSKIPSIAWGNAAASVDPHARDAVAVCAWVIGDTVVTQALVTNFSLIACAHRAVRARA